MLADLHTVPDGECTDEGRAMMQIIHDVAPGASLSFNTAMTSEEDFAQGIVALANDGAKVLVDDVEYFDEPMFERRCRRQCSRPGCRARRRLLLGGGQRRATILSVSIPLLRAPRAGRHVVTTSIPDRASPICSAW